MDEANQNNKIKNIIDFDELNCNSIKYIAEKKNTTIKATTRFIKGKMLMFSKVSSKRFIYDLIYVFLFPSPEVIIYQKNDIIKYFLYLLLTYTDSCFLQFMFVCKLSSTISEKKSCGQIFEIMLQFKIIRRLDRSDKFCHLFNAPDITLKNYIRLYKVESINNPNIITIAVDPKEYFELFRNKKFNKKHKEIRKTPWG